MLVLWKSPGQTHPCGSRRWPRPRGVLRCDCTSRAAGALPGGGCSPGCACPRHQVMGRELPHPEASPGRSRSVRRAGRAPAAGDAGGAGVRASPGDVPKGPAKPSVGGAGERFAALAARGAAACPRTGRSLCVALPFSAGCEERSAARLCPRGKGRRFRSPGGNGSAGCALGSPVAGCGERLRSRAGSEAAARGSSLTLSLCQGNICS